MLDSISTTKMALDVSIRDIAETRCQLDILNAAHTHATYQAGLVLRRFLDNEGILEIKVFIRPGNPRISLVITYDDRLLPTSGDREKFEQAVRDLATLTQSGRHKHLDFSWSSLRQLEKLEREFIYG